MKTSYSIILFLSTIFFSPVILFSQEETSSVAPKYSNEFLQIGVGAEALGRGNAMVAGANDVTSAYWNPAGLTEVTEFAQVGLMHSEYFAGIAKYDYLGIAHSIDDRSTAAFSALRFGVDDIPNTTQLIDNEGNIDYDRITLFTAADYAFLFSYARKLKVEGMSLGGTFKIVHRRAGDFARSWGFGLDAGATYQRNEKWRFGLMARDVTSTFNAWMFDLDAETQEVFLETGNEIPENGLELTLPRLIFASQYKTDFGESGIYTAAELDLDMTTDGRRNTVLQTNVLSFDPHLGVEVGYKEIVAIRAGFGNMQYEKQFDDSRKLTFQPNIGLGVSFKGITLDYAFTDIGDQSLAIFSHVISLKVALKDPPKK